MTKLALIGAMVVTVLNFTVGSRIEVKAAPIVDDTYICTHIHEYPIEQHEAILDYCVGLMERGL